MERAQAAGIPFRTIVADCFQGGNHALETALLKPSLPDVLARRGTLGHCWAPAQADCSFKGAARSLSLRAVCAMTGRRELRSLPTCYLTTNMPPE